VAKVNELILLCKVNIQEAYKHLLYQLFEVYSDSEAANIADMVMEQITQQSKMDRLLNKDLPFTNQQTILLDEYATQLLQHQPVQQVLGQAWFAHMKFFINQHVLIPRPETEELIDWVFKKVQYGGLKIETLLDIGTGSGCIAIALKKKLKNTAITAIDVSEEALAVAQQNASTNNVAINFLQLNFLEETSWQQLPSFDVIISNPPYIKQSESNVMHKNVLEYEPHLALFVPDDDALLFYKKIAVFGKKHLTANGKIFVEINEALGKETTAIFEANGYATTLKKDMQGKDRMIVAWNA
jgi:release factor glutamine methyltransferase